MCVSIFLFSASFCFSLTPFLPLSLTLCHSHSFLPFSLSFRLPLCFYSNFLLFPKCILKLKDNLSEIKRKQIKKLSEGNCKFCQLSRGSCKEAVRRKSKMGKKACYLRKVSIELSCMVKLVV